MIIFDNSCPVHKSGDGGVFLSRKFCNFPKILIRSVQSSEKFCFGLSRQFNNVISLPFVQKEMLQNTSSLSSFVG